MLDPTGLYSLFQDSTYAGSAFLGGVIGNWFASGGEWLLERTNCGLQDLLREDLEKLFENHHLMRAYWVAQCRAMEAVCGRCLKQRFSQTASLLDRDVFSNDMVERFTDPAIRSVLWWMRGFRAEAKRAKTLSAKELEEQFRFIPHDLPLLVRAGAEVASLPDLASLRQRSTEAWLASLESHQDKLLTKQSLGQVDHVLNYFGYAGACALPMPSELRISIQEEWFDLLRVVFRELLKSSAFSEARHAFEMDVLAKLAVGDLPDSSMTALEKLLEEQDTEWSQRWQDIKSWIEKIDLKMNRILQISLRVEKVLKGLVKEHREDFRGLNGQISSLPWTIEQVLRRVIQEVLAGALPATATIGEREFSEAEPRPADLHQYLDAMISGHSNILLPAFGSGMGKMEAVLETMFVGLRGDLATRPQRVLAAQEAESLLDRDDFGDLDEIAHLAATSSVRESRSYSDQGAAVLNFAQAIQAVEARDFRMVILGDPGSGKTTLAKWIALKMARALRAEQTELTIRRAEVFPDVEPDEDEPPMVVCKSYLPVFVRISEYAQILMGRAEFDSSRGILSHIREQVLKPLHGAAKLQAGSSFDRFEESGRLLVILDGLDELPDTLLAHHDPDRPKWKQQIRRTVLTQIRELAEMMRPRISSSGGIQGRNALIVTSRIKGYDFHGLFPGEIVHLTIEPMSLGERKSFFSNWTTAVFERLRQMDKSTVEAPAGFEDMLAAEVARDRRLNREVSTPQMAGLVASVALDFWTNALRQAAAASSNPLQQQLLPKSRTEIYGRAVDILLTNWSSERTFAQGSSDAALAGLMRESNQLLRLLKEVAFSIHQRAELQSGDVEEARLTELALQAGDQLGIPWRSVGISGEVFGKFLVRLLSQDSGFLIQRAAGVFAFQHRSIQEYLAGRLLSEDNCSESGLNPEDSRLRELMLNPRQLIHWREVLLHALAHLQLRNKVMLSKIVSNCLTTEREECRPFPITLLLLLEVSRTLPLIHESELTTLLVHHMALVFAENPSIREPLWPSFRAALLSLPSNLVIAGFERSASGNSPAGLPSSIAEMLIRLGAVRPITNWLSPSIVSLLLHSRDQDSEDLRWPVVRCLALAMTSFATSFDSRSHPVAQVEAITLDHGRRYLSRPEKYELLHADPAFARTMLVLTGCIDYRDSCYTGEYSGFARFLILENAARDEWVLFLKDYCGTDDQVRSIAKHLDSDFKHCSASAKFVPFLSDRFVISLNPRVGQNLANFEPHNGKRFWKSVMRLGQRLRHFSSTEFLLAGIAQTGPNLPLLSFQHRNERLITLLRQRREILTDAVFRGMPRILNLLARTGMSQVRGVDPGWRLAVKATISALAKADVQSLHIGLLLFSLPSDKAEGVILAEWWVWLLNGLIDDVVAHAGSEILEQEKWLLENARSWRCAAIELTSAGASQHQMGSNVTGLEVLYSSQSHQFFPEDIPFHALSNLSRVNPESSELALEVLERIFAKFHLEFPSLSAELHAIQTLLGPIQEDRKSCLEVSRLHVLLKNPAQATKQIDDPYLSCRFAIRLLPVTRHADLLDLTQLVEETFLSIGCSSLRLLLIDAWVVAGLMCHWQGRHRLPPLHHQLSLWKEALAEETELPTKALGLARLAMHTKSRERRSILLEAIACAAKIENPVDRCEVLRELHPLAGVSNELWKAFRAALVPRMERLWHSWALLQNSGPMFWFEDEVMLGSSYAPFCAIQATTLLGEALEVLNAEEGLNAINLWHRCLRAEAPLNQLVSLGRISSFDLSVAVAVALDQLIEQGHHQKSMAQALLPLCVNPSPQVIGIAGFWAENSDPTISSYGKLIRAEILGYVPICDLPDWDKVMDSPDDRSRRRAIYCIRHPLVRTQFRRKRLSKLGAAYLLAWEALHERCRQQNPSLSSDVSWFKHDFICDDSVALAELLDLARSGSALERQRVLKLLGKQDCFDASAWQLLMKRFAIEDDPELQECLLTVVIRLAANGYCDEQRFKEFAAIYQGPGLARLRATSITAATPLACITLFQEHLGRHGSVFGSTAEFSQELELKCRFSLACLDAEDRATFLSHCGTIAGDRLYFHDQFLSILSSQVQTNYAVAGVEFFLRWFCEASKTVDPTCLAGSNFDSPLIVAAVFAIKVPTLLRGNISIPPNLEEQLYRQIEAESSWAIRTSAIILLGECASACPRLLESVCAAAREGGSVRLAAFDVASRIRGIDASFIRLVIPRLEDPSAVVAYLMGKILKYAYLQDDMPAALREEIIHALTRARESEISRRTVYFDHRPRINLPQLPRLDEHFSRILGEIWLGDQAATLQQGNSGWSWEDSSEQDAKK